MKEPLKSRLIALALLFASLFFSVNLSAKEVGRDIQIQWNWDASDKKLIVKIGKECEENPYSFELRKDDKVMLVAQARGPKKIQIEYTIFGLDINARFSKRVSEIFSADARAKTTPLKETVQVTDDLLPGGILTVTFKRVLKADEEETKTVKFRIKDEYPWFFGSVGMIFTTAKNPEVAIIKTKNTITFEINGETQQAYEQIIIMKDNTSTLRPLQSVVSFLNFRIYNPLYISLGFSLNQNIFTEPMIGLSYYFKVKNVGLVGTAGVHFNKETEINSMSEFEEGHSIDPTIGLTVEDISTEEKYKARFFFGFSFRF